MFSRLLIFLLTSFTLTTALPSSELQPTISNLTTTSPFKPLTNVTHTPYRRASANRFGFCPDAKSPTESSFIAGYLNFCDTYIGSSKSFHVSVDTPLLATFDLTNGDGSISKWVYKIAVASDSDERLIKLQNYGVNSDTCKYWFMKFLDTDAAGGLGKAYCVVEGTGGNEQSGEGVVQVLGGMTENKEDKHNGEDLSMGQAWAWLGYYSFRKTGTKST